MEFYSILSRNYPFLFIFDYKIPIRYCAMTHLCDVTLVCHGTLFISHLSISIDVYIYSFGFISG